MEEGERWCGGTPAGALAVRFDHELRRDESHQFNRRDLPGTDAPTPFVRATCGAATAWDNHHSAQAVPTCSVVDPAAPDIVLSSHHTRTGVLRPPPITRADLSRMLELTKASTKGQIVIKKLAISSLHAQLTQRERRQ